MKLAFVKLYFECDEDDFGDDGLLVGLTDFGDDVGTDIDDLDEYFDVIPG